MIAAHAQATMPQAAINGEHGSGVATGTAFASGSGMGAKPAGTTTWLTVALQDRIGRATQHAQPEFEAEAGA